jgi:hypothetical protein
MGQEAAVKKQPVAPAETAEKPPYQHRYTRPGEVRVWRFCIRLGGTLTPKEPDKLARFVGDPTWRYRDGFEGTEPEAAAAARELLTEMAARAKYGGPRSYEFFPWQALLPAGPVIKFGLVQETLEWNEDFYNLSAPAGSREFPAQERDAETETDEEPSGEQ